MALGSIVIRLAMNTADFDTDSARAAKIAERRAKEIGDSFRKASLAAGAAIGGALLGLGTIIAKNTMDAQREVAQLDAILKSTGEAAGLTRDQLLSMADVLSSKSTFSAGEIVEAQTRLLSYSGVLGENIPRAMQAIIDQSARLGISVQQSAETIGRALESPAKAAAALSQQGFGAAFTKEVRGVIDALVAAGREGEAQIMILEILEESYAGAAEAARNTLGGSLSALRNTINDLLTAPDGSLNGMTDAVNSLNEALGSPETRAAIASLFGAIAQLVRELGPPLTKVIDGARIGFTALSGVLSGVATTAIGTIDVLNRLVRFDFSGLKFALGEIERGRAQALAALTADYSLPVPEQVDPRFASVTGGVNRNVPKLSNLPPPLYKEKKAGKSEEQKEAERIQQAYESLMGSMHQRIALFNTEGEAARVRYDIEHGALKALDPTLKAQAVMRAEELDQMERLREEGAARAEAAKEETDRINRGLQLGREVIEDLEFELALMRMSNAERATAIQLRGMEAEAVQEYGDQIAEMNKRIEAEYKEVRFLDGMRGEFEDFFADVITGNKSIEDSFKGMLEGISQMIARRIAENWVDQLFGEAGTSGTGSAGGGWMQMLAGFFGGGRAVGGGVSGGKLFKVNERGVETLRIPGREDFLMTGNSAGQVVPAHQRAPSVGTTQAITQNFYTPASKQSAAQLQNEAAQKLRMATART